MTMTRQEQLDAVVRNYGEWKVSQDHPYAAFLCGDVVYCSVYGKTEIPSDMKCLSFTRAEVEKREAELQNKPCWDDAPEWAKYRAQDEDGRWHWYELIPDVIGYADDGFSTTGGGFGLASEGEVIGDWRDTLEKRPEQEVTPEEEEALKMLEARNGECIDSSGGEVMSQSNSDLYPQYFKDVSGIDEIDVYAVHQLFVVDDPSGAIQHASKKLLLSGVRTGGKGKYKDIKEARDTLNRWLQMNEEK